MFTTKFVHLRLRSEFSILDSTVRIEEALEQSKADAQGSLALTDLNNIFGAVKFYKAARSCGIKPIIGCDFSLGPPDGRHRIVVLVKNHTGYQNLCNLLTWSCQKNAPNITREDLNARNLRGTIVLSGSESSDIGKAMKNNDIRLASQLALDWKTKVPGSFYIEIQRHSQSNCNHYAPRALSLAVQLGVPAVATHPIQFSGRYGHSLHKIRSRISNISIGRNKDRYSNEQYFKTQREMIEIFKDAPTAISNTVEVAKRCNFTMVFNHIRLPEFQTPLNESVSKCLMDFIVLGTKKHLINKRIKVSKRTIGIIKKRLAFEYLVLNKMNYNSYFLIVSDFVVWAKANGIPVGPGRGSGAGSLIAFVLGITSVNPLSFGLLFERFLNPDRISMPDFDVDFCQERRDRVIDYVGGKYNWNFVSQISAFGTSTARASIRDVGRALGFSYLVADGIAGLIPNKANKPASISEALKLEFMLLKKYSEDNNIRKLIDLAAGIEGLIRNVAVHAGGVLIAPTRIADLSPLYAQDEIENALVSQFDKDGVEAIGFIKFDFLGLTTLTIINTASCHIADECNDLDWAVTDSSRRDIKTFDLLRLANTVAVFQLESCGMQEVLRAAQPDCIRDIIALIALYRPGPMKLIDSFFNRKHKRKKSKYVDASLKEVLAETHGIIVYQEQVMQIARIIGGYTLSEADLLRRSMSKKDSNEMKTHRASFLQGALRLGLGQSKPNTVFDLMARFASYGFNKSHATAYAFLSHQTAWLKAHYPTEFMVSNLSWSMGNPQKIVKLIRDCTKNKICVQGPNINRSYYQFKPGGTKICNLFYGLGAIKGIGKGAVQDVVKIRENRPFTDVLDFCIRTNRKVITRRIVEHLIKSGAFDKLHWLMGRCVLIELLPLTLKYSLELSSLRETELLMIGRNFKERLFELLSLNRFKWRRIAALQEERKALGFYLSKHPFRFYKRKVHSIRLTSIAFAKENLTYGMTVAIGGIVSCIESKETKAGRITIVSIEDAADFCNVLFKESFGSYDLKKGKFILAVGKICNARSHGSLRLVASNVKDCNQLLTLYCKVLSLKFFESIEASIVHFVLKRHYSSIGRPIVISIGSPSGQLILMNYKLGVPLGKAIVQLKVLIPHLAVKYAL